VSEREYYYEDEIDLRELIRKLIAGWRWIVGLTLGAGLLALGVSMMLPKQYEATAIVALTKPDIVYRFDPRIETQLEVPPTEGLTELAQSSGIMNLILEDEAATSLPSEEQRVEELQEKAQASLQGTLLMLTMTDTDPDRAAALANAWAYAVVDRIQRTYASSTGEENVFAAQAAEAYRRWEDAQASLTEFQARNREPVLRQSISSLDLALGKSLKAQRDYAFLLSDIEAVSNRLKRRSPQSQANMRDQVTALVLSLRSLSTELDSTSPLGPLELSLGAGAENGLLGETIAEQLAFLDELSGSVRSESERLRRETARLERDLIEGQSELTTYEQERERLQQEVSLARETYETLARKAQEASLANGEDAPAKIAARATPPDEPAGPQIALNAFLAAVLGLILSFLCILGAAWFREQTLEEKL